MYKISFEAQALIKNVISSLIKTGELVEKHCLQPFLISECYMRHLKKKSTKKTKINLN